MYGIRGPRGRVICVCAFIIAGVSSSPKCLVGFCYGQKLVRGFVGRDGSNFSFTSMDDRAEVMGTGELRMRTLTCGVFG